MLAEVVQPGVHLPALIGGTMLALPIALADQTVRLQYTPEALWLMGFGLVPAALAVWLCSPVRSRRPGWLAGAALSLLGALGVYGVQDGYSFLIAWELMSLGGAVMILSERLSPSSGCSKSGRSRSCWRFCC